MVLKKARKRRHLAAVAICGPDGSGKSTLTNVLIETLNHDGVPWRRVYVRPYRVDAVIQQTKRLQSLDARTISDPHALRQYATLPAAVKALIMILDALTLWVDRFVLKRRGGLLIIERSIIDIFVDPTRYGLSRLHSKFLRRLSCVGLVADLVVVCQCSPDIVFARKGETNTKAIISQYSRLEDLEKYRGLTSEVIRVDTTTPMRSVSIKMLSKYAR